MIFSIQSLLSFTLVALHGLTTRQQNNVINPILLLFLGLVLVLRRVEQYFWKIKNLKAIVMKGQGTTFRESVPERKGVTKVVGPSGKEGPVEPIKEKTVARLPVKRY